MSLTNSERGFIPPLEHGGLPNHVRNEKGMLSNELVWTQDVVGLVVTVSMVKFVLYDDTTYTHIKIYMYLQIVEKQA